ncbi:hypothetical protein [Desulfurivibrio dismutans]|uniref:hypothetical protein n=1 Tax=Desulfurivibrio dismutans TaxID=1398908 RepID=UPI0023DC231A|nr:hypothetical protein [Desulfurivibrio alkaliphilus]MDF1614076.1 hypothetical protein [Desulfurivibrio alkaliphilus]
MKKKETMKWMGGLVFAVLALGLAGCSSGSSGSSGGGNGDNDETVAGDEPNGTPSEIYTLSEEEQAFAAALAGPGVMDMASDFAAAAAAPPENPSAQNGDDAADTLSITTRVTSDGNVPVLFECPHPDSEGFIGDGDIRFDEGNLIVISEMPFPAIFSNANSLPAGQHDNAAAADYAHDILLRADCEVSAEEYDLGLLLTGGMDAAQLDNINGTAGRAVAAIIGDFTGTGVADTPDPSEDMEYSISYDLGGEAQTLTSLYRGELYACTGCVGGNLADFTGNPALDGTSQSFLEMSLQLPGGVEFEFQVGEDLDNPFTMQAAATGTSGQATVTMDGRLAYLEPPTGCGFDVTYETVQPLLIDGYDQDNAETVGGELNVTINETGNIYTVVFLNGQSTVYDPAGNEVTPDPDAAAQECDFLAEEI